MLQDGLTDSPPGVPISPLTPRQMGVKSTNELSNERKPRNLPYPISCTNEFAYRCRNSKLVVSRVVVSLAAWLDSRTTSTYHALTDRACRHVEESQYFCIRSFVWMLSAVTSDSDSRSLLYTRSSCRKPQCLLRSLLRASTLLHFSDRVKWW